MNIAVMFSGGVDSTLALVYAINKYKSYKITPISVSNTEYIPYAKKIISKFFNSLEIEYVDNDRNDGVIKTAIGKILSDDRFDIVVTGITQNPLDKLLGQEPIRITPENARKIKKLDVPYVSWTKDFIVSEFYKLNIQHILPYTRSCTEIKHNNPPCLVCWQCCERKWAFDKINKVDEQKWNLADE